MLSAKDPGASRFALVAVLASEDVETCIQKLDGYELHGRIIHVQKVLHFMAFTLKHKLHSSLGTLAIVLSKILIFLFRLVN